MCILSCSLFSLPDKLNGTSSCRCDRATWVVGGWCREEHNNRCNILPLHGTSGPRYCARMIMTPAMVCCGVVTSCSAKSGGGKKSVLSSIFLNSRTRILQKDFKLKVLTIWKKLRLFFYGWCHSTVLWDEVWWDKSNALYLPQEASFATEQGTRQLCDGSPRWPLTTGGWGPGARSIQSPLMCLHFPRQ